MKKIIIYKGDEYRAKIGTEIEEDSFFEEVYKRAEDILSEISEQMYPYNKDRIDREQNQKKGWKICDSTQEKYWGLGKNIIAFCGGRGQGKTSAMKTFAKRLVKAENKERKYIYEVLPCIDPSALENNESVLRLIVSKMFYRMVEFWGDSSSAHEDYNRKKKEEILKLFKKCFTNIDYLDSSKEKDWEMDDLELLVQLGNSTKFKENLKELIEKYLEILSIDSKAKDFLVIQIDDADLVTNRVFRICEDVRNYLSIPNLIVLMATDPEQLTYAIYQNYLSGYKILWKTQQNVNVGDKCYGMAVRYIEKFLPQGHRIQLPTLDFVIEENQEELILEYYDKREKENINCFEVDLESCQDIQEQLTKVVYEKTGIVFLNKSGEIHPFLPHTMRELTHWVKMLGTMEKITWSDFAGENRKVELSKLKHNLLELKQYFMNYWCAQNLDAAQYELIKQIDRAGRVKNNCEVYNSIKEYVNAYNRNLSEIEDLINISSMPKNVSYRFLLHTLVEENLSKKNRLQKAICIYYTIFLNEWFAIVLSEDKEATKIKTLLSFLGTPLNIPQDYLQKKYKSNNYEYNVFHFTFPKESLEKYVSEADWQTAGYYQCLEEFCLNESTEESTYEDKLILEKEGSVRRVRHDVTKLEFDILNPIFYQFYNLIIAFQAKEESSEKIGEIFALRNILLNYDVQQHLTEHLKKHYNDLTDKRKTSDKDLKKLIVEVYKELNFLKNDKRYEYLEINNGIDDPHYIDVCMLAIFLSNGENEEQYIKEYMGKLTVFLNAVKEKLKSLKKVPYDKEKMMVFIGDDAFFETSENKMKIVNIDSLDNDSKNNVSNQKLQQFMNIRKEIEDAYRGFVQNIKDEDFESQKAVNAEIDRIINKIATGQKKIK